MNFRRVLFLLTLILSVRSAAQQYNFRNYSVGEGLAQSQVYAMAEDPLGYLWLGTQGGGVSRFDGQEFRTYTEDDGLPNAFIRCIKTDHEGNIYIGTDEGAVRFDGTEFHPLVFPGDEGNVNDFFFGKDGTLYIATGDSGLVVIKDRKLKEHYFLNHGLPTNRVYCVIERDNGEVWAGTEQGAVRIKNGMAKTFGKSEGFPIIGYRNILEAGNEELWFATYGSGLIILGDSGVKRITVDDGLPNNSIQALLIDHAGRKWIGTSSGVARISGNTVTQFSEREGLCSNTVMSIIEDSWGNIWFGTSGGGACVLDGERFIHYNEKSGDMGTWVYAIHCDRKGHIWFGSSRGGVTEYDGTYYTNYYDGAGFTSFKVKCFGEDTVGGLWFGTVGDGAYYFRSGSFTHYRRTEGLSSNYINAFQLDHFNRVWMGTAGGGISIFDPTTNSFTRIGTKEGLTSTRILSLAQDDAGNMWAASTGGGVYLLKYDSTGVTSVKHFTTKNGLAGDNARCITKDKFGNMWFGFAGGGISRESGNTFITYTKKDGLASDNIYLMICDAEGNLWVGTEKGLDKIAYDKKGTILSVKHYGKGEGLNGIETSLNAACLDTMNNIWFGTINGASVYHPQNEYITLEPPKVHITDIRLFFDPIRNTIYGKGALKNKWFPLPDSLVLPYSENHLRFEFTGIDLRNPEGVRFRWRLIGADKNWTPENNERQATYSNLSPADYVFELQAKNSDGYWSDVQRFSFRITPPVWATWPFRVVSLLIIILVVIGIFRWRVRMIKRKTKQQLEKVTLEKHVLELEQKALRLQMNPHFIFNALQSIQGFIAKNESAEARKYLAKFGKLMRSTLENSRQSYTSIEQEAEALEYYLGLEALCHGNRFSYHISIDEKINGEATFIPVMLIQPFVENAVIHGMHHLGDKQGNIDLRFLLKGKLIVCEIEDNGVGREKAAAFEMEIKKDHKSAALEITRERLAQSSERESKLEIIDLHDNNGNASGTKVVITIGNVVFE